MADARGERGAPLPDRFPPLGQAVPEPVTGHFCGHAVHTQCSHWREEEAHGCHGRERLQSVVGCLHLPPTLPATGDGAHWDDGLGIPREASDVVRRLGAVRQGRPLLDEGIGVRDFFGGGLLATFGGEAPRAVRWVVSVGTVGSASGG